MSHHFIVRGFPSFFGILAAVCLPLVSCTKHPANPDSQLAAKVGSYEITRYQVDSAVATIPNLGQDNVSRTKEAIVQQLVNRELLVQRAQALKLDRAPQVVMAIESARQDILAKAYIAQLTSAIAQPSDSAVEQYFHDHPELFSARKLFALKEIHVQATKPADVSIATGAAATSRTIEEVAQMLRDKGIKFSSATITRGPESLPLNMLPTFFQAKDGGLVGFPVAGGAYVAQIVNTRPAPLDQVTASASIRRYLAAQQDKTAVNETLLKLKKSESVQYFGEFEGLKDGQDSEGGGGSDEATSVPAPPPADQKP